MPLTFLINFRFGDSGQRGEQRWVEALADAGRPAEKLQTLRRKGLKGFHQQLVSIEFANIFAGRAQQQSGLDVEGVPLGLH